ncbi:MAG: hypothetical protein FWE35_17535 [Streptosporangiales bacterium]|nr:hypothetical protein [Streptosporangiales bacterium]
MQHHIIPAAASVYDTLLPFITTPGSPNGFPVTAAHTAASSAAGDGRDPVRPFRAPLLAPVHDPAASSGNVPTGIPMPQTFSTAPTRPASPTPRLESSPRRSPSATQVRNLDKHADRFTQDTSARTG